jgi:DNA-binding SARP family transcriptional activator/uncharacterized protein (DUF924 family)
VQTSLVVAGARQAIEVIPAIFLLGGFRVELGGLPVPETAWQRHSAKTLVKLLALESRHRLHREQLIDRLWPNLDLASATNSFYKALHLARHALEPDLPARGKSVHLRMSNGLLSLEGIWIDVDHFEEQVRAALGSGDLNAFERALATYGGELLPEDRYEDWAIGRREALTERYLALLVGLAELLERRGAYGPAVERLQQVLAIDPAREHVHRQLMLLYARAGSRHQALRQYQQLRATLRQELEVEPEEETELLYQEILTGRVGTLTTDRLDEVEVVLPLPVVLQRQPPAPVVGREPVLEIILEKLTQAFTGQGAMVLIGGEAGVGKTRLAAEVARQAHQRGAVVLWGASHEEEGLIPYGPFVEALEGYITSRPAREQAALAEAYPELRRLPLSLSRSKPGLIPEEAIAVNWERERQRLFAAIARLLSDLETIRPVLLVLDDLHAADAASLQLLHYLARLTPERRWFIMGIYREEDVAIGSELQLLNASLTQEGLCHRVDLLRLAREDCDRLLQAFLSANLLGAQLAHQQLIVEPALLDHIYGLSLGNPLFTILLARTMVEQGQLCIVDGRTHTLFDSSTTVPQQVRELVAARVDRMGEDVRRVLSLAAVAGMEFSFDLMQATEEMSEAQLLDALDHALEKRMLVEREGCYVFRHPLLRLALYERLSPSRRAQLHGAVARALEQQAQSRGMLEHTANVELLAHHYARSNEQEKAALYLEWAGDRAVALYANKVAQIYYQGLVDRLDRLHRPLDSSRVCEKLAAVLTTMACYDEALATLEQAMEVYRGLGELEGMERVMAQIGRVYAFRGTPDEGVTHLSRISASETTANGLLGSLEESSGALTQSGPARASLAALYVALARLFYAMGRHTEELTAAERAVELARVVQNDLILAEAEVRRGSALTNLGHVEEGLQVLERAILLAETAGDLRSLCIALNNVAEVYRVAGKFAQSRTYIERAIAVAKQLGDPARIAMMICNQGVNAYLTGEWTKAREYLEQAERIIGQVSTFWASAYPLLELGRLNLAEGKWAEASRYLEHACTLAERSFDRFVLREGRCLLAERDLLDGNPESAHTHLDCLIVSDESAQGAKVQSSESAAILPMLAWVYLERGDVATARSTALEAIERARAMRDRLTLITALRVRALVATQQHRWIEAGRALEEALSLTRSIKYPYGEARVLQAYGRMCVAKGEKRRGRERLEAARAVFQRLGARKDLERVEWDLAHVTPL